MTIVKLLLVCALTLAPCAALYARFGWSAGKTLPLSLCAQSLILYSFGLFLPFSCCVALLCVICLICGVYFLARAGGIRKILGFWSVPAVLFALGVPLIYYACCDRLYLSYDEYSHWGLIVKLICQYDELPRAGAGAPYLLYNYPPAGAMVPALCGTLMGYREGVAYFGYAVLLWGLLLGLVPEKGGVFFRVVSAAALFFVLMAIFPFALLRLFSEPMIALIFALLTVYAAQEERTKLEWVRTVVLAAFLALTKNTGLLFITLYLLVRVWMRPEKQEWKRSALLAACGAAAYGTYAVYCRVNGIGSAFESGLSANLHALLDGTLHESNASAPGRFIAQFFTGRFPQTGVYFTYGVGTTAAVMYACVMALSGVQTALEMQRQRMLRLWGGVWSGAVLYNAFMLCSYVAVFTPLEAQTLSEFYRYVSLPLLWAALIVCALGLARLSQASVRVRCAAVCVLTAAAGVLSHPAIIYDTLVTRQTVKDTLWTHAQTEQLETLVRGQLNLAQNPKIRLMGDCDQMALRYELVGEAEFGGWNDSWSMGAYVGTLEGVRTEIEQGGYDYVLIGRMDGSEEMRTVDARYAALFDGGEAAMRPLSLYRVEKSADGVRLVYMATAE